MTNKKNNTASIESLRADADAKANYWYALDGLAKAKRGEQVACPTSWRHDRPVYSADDVRSCQLDIEALEAESKAERARHVAVLAQEAVLLAEQDENALARSAKHLHADWMAFAAEEASLREQLQELYRRRDERLQSAHRADAAYAARCSKEGLPPPARLPHFQPMIPLGAPTYAQLLAKHCDDGEPTKDFTARITQARERFVVVAARVEEARRAKEREEQEKADRKRFRDEAIAAEQARVHAREQAQQEERDAEQRERAALAAAYLARQSGGTP